MTEQIFPPIIDDAVDRVFPHSVIGKIGDTVRAIMFLRAN
jgi:hypothetical protein